MVDFRKRLAGKKAERPIDPIKLYDTLDRAHDKYEIIGSGLTNHMSNIRPEPSCFALPETEVGPRGLVSTSGTSYKWRLPSDR